MRNHLFIGDSRQVLAQMPDESYHLIVTSPPYWRIKDYGHPNQIGFGQTFRGYIESMALVLGECARVLHPGCRMSINIGDQYLSAKEHGRYRIAPIPSYFIQSLNYQDHKVDFMGQIIWRKISTTNPSGGGSWMGSTYYPRDGQITYEHEYILLFRKRGSYVPDAWGKENSRLTKEQRSKWFRGVWDDIPPVKQTGPMACFPKEIPERLIRMYSMAGELVLDPFAGMHTTMIAAKECGRIGHGIDLKDWTEDDCHTSKPGWSKMWDAT